MPDPGRGPGGPGDVLVEVLPGAEAEGEPAAGQHGDGGRLLRHHRGVVAERRAGHERHQRQPLGRLSRRAEHGPGVRRVALLLEPREVVVRHHGEVEARCSASTRPVISCRAGVCSPIAVYPN